MATIRKRSGKFEVQIRRLGQPSQTKTFHLRKDAETWARQTEIQADRHDLPTSEDRKKLDTTVGELVTRYRDTVSVRKKTAKNERIVLAAFGLHPICRKTLRSLRTSDFAAYRDERLEDILPTSLKRELTPIRHMFEVARTEWGIPVKNPLTDLVLDAPDQKRDRRLRQGDQEHSEWVRLMVAAYDCRRTQAAYLMPMVIRLAVETAMRRSEILHIKKDHLHVYRTDQETYAQLDIPETKNGERRSVPMTSTALAILQERLQQMWREREKGELLFPITGNAVRLAWVRITDRAGIEDLHFHDLRHEAISRLFEKGLTLPEVALISGHKDPRMLLRYTHAQRKLIRAKLQDAGKPARYQPDTRAA